MEDDFLQLNQKMDFPLVHMDERFDATDSRIDVAVNELATAVKQGFDEMDNRFEAMDDHFVRVETEMHDGFAKTTERSKRVDIDLTACTRRINRLENAFGI